LVGLLLGARTRPRVDLTTGAVLALAPAGQLLALLALGGLRGPELRGAATGDDLRRRLWLCTAWLSATGLALQASTGTADMTGALIGLALAPGLLPGAMAGKPLARRLDPRRHRLAVLVLAAAGALTLLAGA
jgi:hypothetical protein